MYSIQLWNDFNYIYLSVHWGCMCATVQGWRSEDALPESVYFHGVYDPLGIKLISPCLAERAFTHWTVPPAQVPKLSEAGGSIRGRNFRIRFQTYGTWNFPLCKSRSKLQGEMQIMIIPLFIPSFKIDVTLEPLLSDSIFLNKVQSYACCPFFKHKNNF